MNVCILEDDQTRVQSFRDRFGIDVDIFTTDSVERAKTLLQEFTFDIVLLDHDLADFRESRESLIVQAKLREETGYHLASWLAENEGIAKKHERYLCHSLNASGAERIVAALRSIGIFCWRAPFLWLKPTFDRNFGGGDL